MGHLEIKHLKMVQTIAGTGTLTRAAQALFLSQSALSQQLKEIETRLQTPLFHRTRKQMLLTPMGQKILATADQVIRMMEDTETDIARMVSGETGELKIGTQCMFCYRWLPKVMESFQEKFPNVELEIGNAFNASRELEKGIYNLVVSVLDETNEKLSKVPLFRDEILAVVKHDNPLAQKKWLEFTDFDQENIITIRSRSRNRFFQKYLKPRGIHPKRFMVVGDPGAMMEMTVSGFGIAMAPGWAIQSQLSAGRIRALSITRPGMYLTWQAIFLKNNASLVFLQEFIRLISRAGIASLPNPGDRNLTL